jgi:hypothetical protein
VSLETGTYISDLNTANPTASDPKSQGDDHLRLIKSTVKATFPNVTGAVTLTHTQINTTAQLASPAFTGTPTAPTVAATDNSTTLATTAQVQLATPQIFSVSATVAANALTVNLAAANIDFRSATLTSGTVTRRTGSAISVVVPSTATLGTVNAIQSRIMVLALDNAGTVELAVVNLAGGTSLTETGVISTTAISVAATSSSVVYSTTARTNIAYRVVGFVESTQATAGTWATAPSLIQGMGGEAVGDMSSLGYGQTWQDVTGSRSSATTYYNTTGRPIQVAIVAGTFISPVSVGGVTIYAGVSVNNVSASFIVPPGMAYSATTSGGHNWYELR